MSNLLRPTSDGRTAPKAEEIAPSVPAGDPPAGAGARGSADGPERRYAPAAPRGVTPGSARSTAATGAAAMGRSPDPPIPALQPFTGEPNTVGPISGEPATAEPIAVDPIAVDPQAVEPQAVEPQAAESRASQPSPIQPQTGDRPVTGPIATEDLGIRQAKADESPAPRVSAADASLLDGTPPGSAASRAFTAPRAASQSGPSQNAPPRAKPATVPRPAAQPAAAASAPTSSPVAPERSATLRAHRPDDTGTPG